MVMIEKAVLKFGGTSVQDAESIRGAAEIVKAHPAQKKIVVVSAFGGVTNRLYEAWERLLARNEEGFESIMNEIRDRSIEIARGLHLDDVSLTEIESVFDDILASRKELLPEKLYGMGEEISSRIIARYLITQGLNATHRDSRDYLYVKGGAKDFELESGYTYKKLGQLGEELGNAANGTVYLMPGFVAMDSYGRPSILGRGGSDFSAALFAAGIGADRLEIWTDVSGMLSADPKRIPHAKKIQTLTYKEASELAYFGAKVLHPKTLLPAIEKNIPVWIKNTKAPDDKGTLIDSGSESARGGVKAISSRGGITIVNIVSNRMLGAYGFMKKVFEIFEKYRTPVDLVTTTEVSVSVTIDDTEFLSHIKEELAKFSSVSTEGENCSISIVGEGLGLTAGVAARAFAALRGINVKMVSFGASEVNLSLVVCEADRADAIQALHKELIEE